MRFVILTVVSALLQSIVSVGANAEAKDPSLERAVGGPQRSPQFIQRDKFRHPVEELRFFGIKPAMTVVEIWPEGGYWTEILAPYLHGDGTYYAAIFQNDWGQASDRAAIGNSFDDIDLENNMANLNCKFQAKLDADKATYGNVKVVGFGKGHDNIPPPGSTDMIVSFRNVHNWMSWVFPILRSPHFTKR